MQVAYGSAQDPVYFTFGQLSVTALRDGTHDLAVADRFQRIGIGLLIAVFTLVLGIMVYFARRLTVDIVRPVEILQAAAERLREGSLEHRIDVGSSTRANEVGNLADAFNEMAVALYESHHELSRRAAFDGLTGLPNRASFNDRLASQFAPHERRLETVSVLFIDVDDFKFVNDSLGHAAGDSLLVGVAERLASCVRPYDFLARLGGDEFAILALDTPGQSNSADAIAQRVLEVFKTPFVLVERSIRVAVSIGLSTARSETADSAGLLAEADFAMYTAKRAGKGRREVFDPGATPVPSALVAISPTAED